MARAYAKTDITGDLAAKRHNAKVLAKALCIGVLISVAFPVADNAGPLALAFFAGLLPMGAMVLLAMYQSKFIWIEQQRKLESERRSGKPVLGLPPNRQAYKEALDNCRAEGKIMIDRYLVGFELDSGEAIWVTDDELCSHGCVFAKTGVGKTLWLEGLMFQQMARGRASGFTFIDAKRDPGVLADIIMMALITGRIEDLLVVDPFDPVCAYNFVFTTQRPDVKARKVLRCGLPPTSDASTTKHYDRLAADAVYRVVRAMESLGLAWSVRDVAVALSAFQVAYPRMRELLHDHGEKQALIELGHLASTYRGPKGTLDGARLTDNLRGIASELHSISNSEAGEMFCVPRADLSLTDAVIRGKLVYYMLPRLEEAEAAARMVKVFREDLEVSIGEVTSSRHYRLEDPHMVIIDEGASTFGPTWANLFELARKGRFALLFGAQSVGGLMDEQMGLSEQFYERVIANVNLKVIMRLGDNRTAEEMAEWIGKITTSKKSINTAISSSFNARELTKNVEINRRSSDGFRDGVTMAEDEEDLVSPEELKHEMSAEKGLAWFEKGDGRLRKGRAIWFEGDLPQTWEGREFLTRYEAVEADEIGLAEWVDEHILSTENAENERSLLSSLGVVHSGPSSSSGSSGYSGSSSSGPSSGSSGASGEEPKEDGPFRINLLRPFRGKMRARTFVSSSGGEEEAAVASVPEIDSGPVNNPTPDSLPIKVFEPIATELPAKLPPAPEASTEDERGSGEPGPTKFEAKPDNSRHDQKRGMQFSPKKPNNPPPAPAEVQKQNGPNKDTKNKPSEPQASSKPKGPGSGGNKPGGLHFKGGKRDNVIS